MLPLVSCYLTTLYDILWDLNKNRQQINNILTALLLSPKISVIKIEAYTERTEPEFQRNALVDFHAKVAATECTKIVAQMDEVHPASLKMAPRASLVAQWLRICLLMQGTRVRALVWEDPTCRGAAGPVSHNC